MSYTKRQIILAALDKLTLRQGGASSSAEEEESAVLLLDAMMGRWNMNGVRLGYPVSNSPSTSDTSQSTGLPSHALEAVINNLAKELGPSYGKTVPREIKVAAHQGYMDLQRLAGVTDPIEKQFPSTLPRGAGAKSYRDINRTFFPKPVDPISAGPDSDLDFY